MVRLHSHALSLTCTQAGQTKKGISILYLSFSLSPTKPLVFKIEISVFQAVALVKKQRTAFLGSATGTIKHSGFFP
jgi:hypothetical protein